jgi:hypothetical protein
VGRPEVSQAHLLTVKLKAMTDHIEGALAVEHAGEAVEERSFKSRLMVLTQLVPGIRLSRLDEGEEVWRIESQLGVEVGRVTLAPACFFDQVRFDRVFECAFGVHSGRHCLSSSIACNRGPVTNPDSIVPPLRFF